MRRYLLGLLTGAILFTGTAAAHEETGQADYTLPARGLLNDHVCAGAADYKFIAADGDRVRCVDRDGGFPHLAPHE